MAAADRSPFANGERRDAILPVHRQRTQCKRGGGIRAGVARQCFACAFNPPCRRCQAAERTVSASSVHLMETDAFTPSNQVPCLIVTATTAGGVLESSSNIMICLAFQHGDSPSPNLSSKNGVLDNGSYHESRTIFPSGRA